MCGIAALINLTDATGFEPDWIKPMTRALAHRGPDGEGFHTYRGVALGHRRLSIIDLGGGHQPMLSLDEKTAVVFNGEIYNFQTLREELLACGAQFRTVSDTEVILEAWRFWGPECVKRFHGMFTIILWDDEAQTLFVARDRLGKKPLYYSHLKDGSTAFASELKGLKCLPSLNRDLDLSAIEDYFSYGYIADPKSIYAGVKKLPPATIMVWKKGQDPKLERYWDPDLEPVLDTSLDLTADLNHRLSSATKERLVSDVPLGAFLSGGVDSSAIVALMALGTKEPVKTFSIGFDGTKFDETEYAKIVAERYHTDHQVHQIDANDFSLIDRLSGIFDEPFGDSSALPTYRVCEVARKEVTVALSGDGGDELFGGYRRHYYHAHEEALRRKIPAGIRKAIFGPLGQIYPKLDWAPQFLRARTTFQELGGNEAWGYFNGVSATADETRFSLYSQEFRARLGGYHGLEVLKPHFDHARGSDPLARAQYVDLQTWLAGGMLVKVDRTSMAVSLEVRAPLLDHQLAEWALRLPQQVKLEGREGKAILKKAMHDKLPHDIMYRPKQGFSIPIADWFRGPLKTRVEALSQDGVMMDCGHFDRAAISKMSTEHISGRRDHSRTLWLLFMFASFLENE
jgi:asparagine synthase (glutamine-hydrolysing)